MSKTLKGQGEFKDYAEKYGLEAIFTDLINATLHEKSENPISFMLKYLTSLMSESELGHHGIFIQEIEESSVRLSNQPLPTHTITNPEQETEEISDEELSKARVFKRDFYKMDNERFSGLLENIESVDSGSLGCSGSEKSASRRESEV